MTTLKPIFIYYIFNLLKLKSWSPLIFNLCKIETMTGHIIHKNRLNLFLRQPEISRIDWHFTTIFNLLIIFLHHKTIKYNSS